MSGNDEIKEIVEAIANLTNRIEILERAVVRIETTIDFLKAGKTPSNKWDEWARRLIIALIASLLAAFGSRLIMP